MGISAETLIILLAAYLLGSIPFGLVLSKLFGLGDLRKKGSGNIGATNMLRVGGKKLALLTVLLDGLKGFVAVKMAVLLGFPTLGIYAGAISVIGHIFPIWLQFKGGKGVATTFFVLLAVAPAVAAITFTSWIITFYFTRISSLSALVATVMAPIAAWFLVPTKIVMLTVCLSFLIILRHRENIGRLLRGEEAKFSSKR